MPNIARFRPLSFCFRLLAFAACLTGLILLLRGQEDTTILRYFTIQSNLLLAGLYGCLLVGSARQMAKSGIRGEAFCLPKALQTAVVFYITVTFSVYALLLSESNFNMSGAERYANLLAHYIAPILAILDWLLFLPHGHLKIKHAAFWLSYPVAYIVYSFIRAAQGVRFADGARFPYFFMDADLQGANLIWICPLFIAAFFALGCLYVLLDWSISKLSSHTHEEGVKAGPPQ